MQVLLFQLELPHKGRVNMRYVDIDRALKAVGFELIRTNGSHCYYVNKTTDRKTIVPNKGTEDIDARTLKNIEKQVGITLSK